MLLLPWALAYWPIQAPGGYTCLYCQKVRSRKTRGREHGDKRILMPVALIADQHDRRHKNNLPGIYP